MDNSFPLSEFLEKFFNQQSSFDIMNEVGAGQVIFDLRRQIQKLTLELTEMDGSLQKVPELITSTNLLRSNEILSNKNSKQSEIIFAYEKYSKELESMLKTVFEIQKELKDILKIQTSLISEPKAGKKRASQRKKSKK